MFLIDVVRGFSALYTKASAVSRRYFNDVYDNNVGMTDFTALNIVDSVIVPHANKKKEEYINEVKEKTNNKVIFLYDGDGIII